MSRDQRPGRVKMIDASPPPEPTEQIGDGAGSAIVDDTAPTAPDLNTAKSRIMQWSALFLIACIAGAAGVTLLPWLGIG